jgi:NADH-quinone oxidoreductase subunit D
MSEVALVNNPNVGLDKTQKGGPYVNELSTLNLGPTHLNDGWRNDCGC